MLCLPAPAVARRWSAVSEAVSAPRRGATTTAAAAGEQADWLVAVGRDHSLDAFEALFRVFAPKLKAYLSRFGGDAASAEELMQETMVTIWRKAHQFDPARASAGTWIFTVARNLRVDAFRRDRRPRLDLDDPTLLPEDEPQPDGALIRAEEAARLTEALSNLSDAEQAVLRLAYFEGLTQERISVRLGLPLGTVKSRIRLAFGKLRRVLGPPDDQP